ncbi:hypothetical protein [Bacillus sp. AK031]
MEDWQYQFQRWKSENKLLTVEYLIEKKGKFSLSGRLLQYNADTQTLIFYVDDLKSVQTLSLNQIENISDEWS